MLNNISFETIAKEKHSAALHEAAIALGGNFMSLDLAEQGIEVVTEMRRQVITGKSITTKKFGFDIPGRQGFIYLHCDLGESTA